MTSNEGRVAGESPEPSASHLLLAMLALVVVGGPLVYVLWGAINNLLLGDFERVRVSIVLPAAVIFIGLVYYVSRLVRRWEGEA